ncbi:hypothetical protein OG21DRAFT_1506968 [Imleria badia]|nr:hypothetical protein OG21DRAFT_1506968 [Imleria badia]
MRFSLFAVLSGLAVLGVVNALPADNLQARADVPICNCPNDPTTCNPGFSHQKQCVVGGCCCTVCAPISADS